MSENLKVSKAAPESGKTEVGRDHSDKLQALAKNLVSGLYMLVRSVKLYSPDNAIFDKPLVGLRDTVNQIVAFDRRLELQVVRDSFYLNNMLIKVDVGSLENVRYLAGEMQAKDVGGFSLYRSTTAEDLKGFIAIFAKDQPEKPGEDGLAGRKLLQMKVKRFAALKEKLSNAKITDNTDRKVDRKKYAMTCFARAVYFLRQYRAAMAEGKPLPVSKAARIVQDLVDVSFEHRTHFLGLTMVQNEAEYHLYHPANTALLAIVLGNELGFTKPQLADLGLMALFHDLGSLAVKEEVLARPGALLPEERRTMECIPLYGARLVLSDRSFSRAALLRFVVTSETKLDWGIALRDEQGNVASLTPAGRLTVYARIISLCSVYDALVSNRPYRDAFGPEIALAVMWTELRHKFDPELLDAFMNMMAVRPTKFLQQAKTLVFD